MDHPSVCVYHKMECFFKRLKSDDDDNTNEITLPSPYGELANAVSSSFIKQANAAVKKILMKKDHSAKRQEYQKVSIEKRKVCC